MIIFIDAKNAFAKSNIHSSFINFLGSITHIEKYTNYKYTTERITLK